MLQYDAIIIGGGPAGSSAAICLAEGGARVLLLEEKRMPREKLCGEFITPECFPTLQRLGVMDRMLAAGAQKIEHVSLVVSSGKSVSSHMSEMSNGAAWAMSLSRSRFDQILLDRAREAGAECLEAIAVRGCVFDDGVPRGVEALSLSSGTMVRFESPIVVDASGRNSRLMIGKQERITGRRGSRLYALKAHFKGIEGIGEQLELYFFPQGYGGLSRVEAGLFNLCFIVDERSLKEAGADPTTVVQRTIMNNRLARERLQGAEVVGKWYSAGPLEFGPRRLERAGVIAIGDASGMIDPFTGTGVQIALRTGEMAATAILEITGAAPDAKSRATIGKGETHTSSSSVVDSVVRAYGVRYRREFDNRMKVASFLRVAAFSPPAASVVAAVLARVPCLATLVLRATRSGSDTA